MFLQILNSLLATRHSTPSTPSRPDAVWAPPASLVPGEICQGTVAYVGPRFAKIRTEGGMVFVHIGEMASHRIACAAEVLREGQGVDVVVLDRSAKVPGEWEGSLLAVAEARKRQALSGLRQGQQLQATVLALRDNGAQLVANGVELFAPLGELSWNPLDHPAQALTLGQLVQAEVKRLTIPVWQPAWRQARSSAIASLRACQPRPRPVFIPMAFSALPFRLAAHTRRPPGIDSVVLHVLAELVAGHGMDEISLRTRLPAGTLRAMAALLAQEGLLRDGAPTQRARDLIDAEDLARDINDGDHGGLVANAAPADVRYLDMDGKVPDPPYSPDSLIPEYPATWPQPACDKRADESFLRLGGESIPEAALALALDGVRQTRAAALLGDNRLQLRLRAGGARRPVCTAVPDQWVHAALWAAFDAVGRHKPYRPEAGTARAGHLVLVQAQAFDADGALVGDVFYEPYSATLWQLRDAGLARMRSQQGAAFPPMPALQAGGLRLAGGKVATRLQATAWQSVQFREAGKSRPA